MLAAKQKWPVKAIIEEAIRAALAPIIARLLALEGKPDADGAAAFQAGLTGEATEAVDTPANSEAVEAETPEAEPKAKKSKKSGK